MNIPIGSSLIQVGVEKDRKYHESLRWFLDLTVGKFSLVTTFMAKF